ncbi:hypothetical protein K2X89_11055 [Myxococcota bacterium]|nr:hypothetical protein [Myxococcota bacterium]
MSIGKRWQDSSKILEGDALAVAERTLQQAREARGDLDGAKQTVTSHNRTKASYKQATLVQTHEMTHGPKRGAVLDAAVRSGFLDGEGLVTDLGRSVGLSQEDFDGGN